ncbi:Pol Polyprotein [Phytophthora megakarya]|uniref:Pol Polyprotein n=1 Tax=Phytophthora megakarya TaxID=4795 RepID=A0A225W0F2_9STRA|nr:Pol Polyprotein [Phytophthora megakarya]
MKIVELKDLGVVSNVLGIAFNYDGKDGWTLSQKQVILDIVTKFGMDKAAAVRIPISGEQDDENPGELLPSGGGGSPGRPTVRNLQPLVGSLLWIARCTRPDVAFTVHCVTRNAHAPSETDW